MIKLSFVIELGNSRVENHSADVTPSELQILRTAEKTGFKEHLALLSMYLKTDPNLTGKAPELRDAAPPKSPSQR